MKSSDYVVAPHPNYIDSYAPAQITTVYSDNVEVQFYDHILVKCQKTDIYQISKKNYKQSVEEIEKCEEKLSYRSAIVLDVPKRCFRMSK